MLRPVTMFRTAARMAIEVRPKDVATRPTSILSPRRAELTKSISLRYLVTTLSRVQLDRGVDERFVVDAALQAAAEQCAVRVQAVRAHPRARGEVDRLIVVALERGDSARLVTLRSRCQGEP